MHKAEFNLVEIFLVSCHTCTFLQPLEPIWAPQNSDQCQNAQEAITFAQVGLTGVRLVLIRREIENKHLAPFFKFRALVLVTVKPKNASRD